ncbi:MAG: hypothetical protein ABFC84_02575 [Veillonellales bacterium]
MSKDVIQQGRLPACNINSAFMDKLWNILGSEGDFTWEAKVGTDDDLLGEKEEQNRSEQIVTEWSELTALLAALPRIDSLKITVEIPGQGSLAIMIKSYAPARGALAVSGDSAEWVNAKFADIEELFVSSKDSFAAGLYSYIGFGMIHTVIPLSAAFVIVMLLAGLLIPSEIRHSDWVWWITAICLLITLRLAYTISDRLMLHFMKKYPYLRWLS